MDFNALRNARRTIDYLHHAGIDRNRIRLIANQYGRQKELSRGQAEEALHMKISHFIPEYPKTVIASLNCGEPAVIGSPKSRLTKAIKQMVDAVVTAIVD